jgi:hypothetical protein
MSLVCEAHSERNFCDRFVRVNELLPGEFRPPLLDITTDRAAEARCGTNARGVWGE